jgi:hypothetical protein
MKDTRLNPEELLGAAQELGACADDLGAGLTRLQATVTTENPWGADEAGSLFALAYLEVLGHALDVLGSHVDLIGDAADGIADMAMDARQSDEDSEAILVNLQQQFGD